MGGGEWLSGEELLAWFETEASPRLLDGMELDLDAMPDGRAWSASLWSRGWGHVLLFEEHHWLGRGI